MLSLAVRSLGTDGLPLIRVLLALLTGALLAFACRAAERLEAVDADTRAVTVSGVSSGGFMAVQFHLAHSSTVRGVGVLGAGPYYCAMGSVWTALNNCMTPSAWARLPSTDLLVGLTRGLARGGAIDPLAGVADAKVWLFSGTRDETVGPEVVAALRDFYRAIAPRVDIAFVADVPAGHAMVTSRAGNVCATSEPPYINNCGYDAAGALLAHLLGKLEGPAERGGRLIEFDQREFAGGAPGSVGLADSGYAWLPRQCERERCRVHVVFHGCRQNAQAVGERFAREAGYNRWAETNRIIVLYPQTIARWGWRWGGGFVFNPRGCWDWWGYTGPAYPTKTGPQIHAVQAMVERLGTRR
ncbi:MAG TPA: depolymerase [Burkholderiales bacterium]